MARTSTPEPATARWPSRAGAWIGIGSSPAALVMGAGLAARHGGALPVTGVVVGASTMAALLLVQGRLGLRPPLGEGGTLADVAGRHLTQRSALAMQVLMAAAMVGWFAFNVGLGGASLGVVVGVPDPWGQVLLAAPIAVVALGGLRRWNLLAVVTTAASLVMVGLVLVRLAPPGLPLRLTSGEPLGWVADATAFIGYAAVFALRAPDFTAGLARRRDLLWCVGLLVGPLVVVTLAGAALHRGTLATDVVGAISRDETWLLGNTLIAAAVVAATFTTLHSGSLALSAAARWPERRSLVTVLVLGTLLAAVRFDRHLLSWLTILSAVLPALIVPLALAARWRRAGRRRVRIGWTTWVPGAATGAALVLLGQPLAAFAAMAVAGGCMAARRPGSGQG